MDAQTQALVEEYKKTKAQNAVLKKAVLAEQKKVAEGQAALQTAREENDALAFNNKRLTRRVEQLMKEMESGGGGGGGKSAGSAASSMSAWMFGGGAKPDALQEELQVVREELTVKIQENEMVHMQMFEQRQEQEEARKVLEDEIASLKAALAQREGALREQGEKAERSEARLNSEIEAHSVRARELGEQLASARASHEAAAAQLAEQVSGLEGRLAAADAIVRDKVPFHDSRVDAWNHLNVDPHDSSFAQQQTVLAQQCVLVGQKFAAAWQAHIGDKCARFDLDAGTRDLVALLTTMRNDRIPGVVAVLERLSTTDLAARGDVVRALVPPLSGLALLARDALTAELLVLSKETDPAAPDANAALADHQTKTVAALEALVDACRGQQVRGVVEQITALGAHLKGYAGQVHAKTVAENRRPMASTQLREANDALARSASLTATTSGRVVTAAAAIADHLQNERPLCVRGARVARASMDARVGGLRKRACAFVAQANAAPRHESIPFERVRELAKAADDLEAAQVRIRELQAQVTRRASEAAERPVQCEAEVQCTLAAAEGAAGPTPAAVPAETDAGDDLALDLDPAKELDNARWQHTQVAQALAEPQTAAGVRVIGRDGSTRESLRLTERERERERSLREFYEDKLLQMQRQIEAVDKKALEFHQEYDAVVSEMQSGVVAKRLVEEQKDEVERHLADLQDKLEITTRNYEQQIKLMTEHIVELTAK